MCYYPILLQDHTTKDGTRNLKPRLVPCGKCFECLQNRRAQWSFRLNEEFKKASSAAFVTLTYNDENLPKDSGNLVLKKKHIQDYFKRVRSASEHTIKYYAVGEYGEKNYRPHYHAIVFNADRLLLHQKWCNADGTPIGIVYIGDVTPASIHYVTGYIMKKHGDVDYKHGYVSKNYEGKKTEMYWAQKSVDYPSWYVPPFSIMSKGLGLAYVNNAQLYHLSNETFKTQEGGNIPRYIKDKIFEGYEEVREKVTEKERIEFMAKAIKTGYVQVIGKRKGGRLTAKSQTKKKKL